LHAVAAAWYAALVVSTVVAVVLEAPGLKDPTVTPCSFMQFLYEANAVLFAPLAPPAPLG
jgi:hypothetical protein